MDSSCPSESMQDTRPCRWMDSPSHILSARPGDQREMWVISGLKATMWYQTQLTMNERLLVLCVELAFCKVSVIVILYIISNAKPGYRIKKKLKRKRRLVWGRKIEIVISQKYRGHSLNIWCRRIAVHSSGTNWIGVQSLIWKRL